MEQSLLKIVKRWRRYELRGNWSGILPKTRGFYVLYKKRPKAAEEKFDVVYIGVAGLGKGVRRGIKGRLKRHHNKKEGWTHYSFFEVHDNVTREDIREIESLLLSIFRHDSRVRLQNIQKSSRILQAETTKDVASPVRLNHALLPVAPMHVRSAPAQRSSRRRSNFRCTAIR